jgi:hypothetical protein
MAELKIYLVVGEIFLCLTWKEQLRINVMHWEISIYLYSIKLIGRGAI